MMYGIDAKSAVEPLKGLIHESKSGKVQSIAAIALIAVTPETESVTRSIVPWLKSLFPLGEENVPKLKEGAVPNLRFMGVALTIPAVSGPLMNFGHTKIEVPELLNLATDQKVQNELRALAILVLAEFGHDASGAVTKLMPLLDSQDKLIRISTANALVLISKNPKVLDQVLPKLEQETCQAFEKETLLHLKRAKNIHDELIAALEQDSDLRSYSLALLNSRSGYFRRKTIRDLSAARVSDPQTVAALKKLLSDPDSETRRLAKDALVKIRNRDEKQ